MSDPMPNNHDHQAAEVPDLPEYTPTWASQHGANSATRDERGL